MNPAAIMWLIIALSFLAASASGGSYLLVALRQPLRDRYPGNLCAAGCVVALLAGLLVLMLVPLAIPTPGAQGPGSVLGRFPRHALLFPADPGIPVSHLHRDAAGVWVADL